MWEITSVTMESTCKWIHYLINIKEGINVCKKNYILFIIANWVFYIKSNCKYIIGINLIDMTYTNFVTDLNWQHFSVLCLLLQFSGFLLDLVFQGFVVNIRLYLTVPRVPTTTGINVGFRCHIRSISISRSFFIFFEILPTSFSP